MTMRKLLTALAAVSAVAVSLPAMAQDFGYRLNQLQERIEDGARDGQLTAYEARDLRSRLYDLERLQTRYESEGMRGWMANNLDRRIDALSNDIYAERHNNQYRYERYEPF
jgi:hypothetical protein